MPQMESNTAYKVLRRKAQELLLAGCRAYLSPLRVTCPLFTLRLMAVMEENCEGDGGGGRIAAFLPQRAGSHHMPLSAKCLSLVNKKNPHQPLAIAASVRKQERETVHHL